MNTYHSCKSQEAKETYLEYYGEYTKRWPIASEEKVITTSQNNNDGSRICD